MEPNPNLEIRIKADKDAGTITLMWGPLFCTCGHILSIWIYWMLVRKWSYERNLRGTWHLSLSNRIISCFFVVAWMACLTECDCLSAILELVWPAKSWSKVWVPLLRVELQSFWRRWRWVFRQSDDFSSSHRCFRLGGIWSGIYLQDAILFMRCILLFINRPGRSQFFSLLKFYNLSIIRFNPVSEFFYCPCRRARTTNLLTTIWLASLGWDFTLHFWWLTRYFLYFFDLDCT